MVSVHQQQQQPHQSRRTSRKMAMAALSATDEFWHSPILTQQDHQEMDSTNDSNDEQHMTLSLPPAHHQLLLSKDDTSVVTLAGYDHTAISVGYDNLDGYASSSSISDSDESSSWCSRQKLSAVKQQGGGSWLLGFVERIHTEKAVIEVEPQDDVEELDMTPPGLVRVPSGSSLEDDSSSDESESDDESTASSASSPSKPPRRRAGISFAPTVQVQHIPHSVSLSPLQRRKMFSNSFEVRQNKIRNKKEYRYDGYDWRNITEEWEMGVDMVTGELVHPVHEHSS
jgi:hypothetical protein